MLCIPQPNLFVEFGMSHTNDKRMSHVATCIKDLTDKDYDVFKPEDIDLYNCVMYINAWKTDSKGKVLLGSDGNPVVEQVMVITNATAYEVAKELQKHKA